MRGFKTLFRLELKARFGTRGASKPWLTAFKIILGLILVGVMYALYIFGMQQLIAMFHLYEMSTEFLVIFIALSQLILTLFGVGSVLKNLYRSGDNELMMRFPVSPTAVFAAKILIFVATQIIFTLVIELPTFIIFGQITAQDWSFYAFIPLVLIFSVLLPLSISNLLAIPSMYISTRMKNLFTLSLIISVVLVALGFAIYMNVVQGVVNYMKEQSMSFFSKGTLAIVSKATKYIYPSNWFAYMMVGRWRLGSTLLSVVVVATFVVGAIFLNKQHYLKTILRDIEGGGVSFTKVTKNKVRTQTWAVFRREFLDIFRSSNYSFQYLCMAVAAPVMVFYCNKLAASMGENTIGGVIVPALSLMVMLIFCSIILSFAASSVSREGDNFYLTKIIPVHFRIQIFVKLGLYMLVSTLSILATTLAMLISKQVDAKSAFSAFGICFMMSIAITCFSIRLDVTRPQFAVGGDGELSIGNISTFVALFVGFAFSVGYGLLGMVGIILWGVPTTFGILGGISGVLMIGSVLWLMIGLDKKYNMISQR